MRPAFIPTRSAQRSPTIGAYPSNPNAPATLALGVSLASTTAAFLASYLGWDAAEPLTRIAEIFAAAVSFEQLNDVSIGPLIRNGIAKVADMHARRAFRQELPASAT